jgi:DNA polymerase II large subunit
MTDETDEIEVERLTSRLILIRPKKEEEAEKVIDDILRAILSPDEYAIIKLNFRCPKCNKKQLRYNLKDKTYRCNNCGNEGKLPL